MYNILIEMLAQCIGYCRFNRICRIIFLWPFIFLWHTCIIKELIWIEGWGETITWPRPKAEHYFTCKNHQTSHHTDWHIEWMDYGWIKWMDGLNGWIEWMHWMDGLNGWIERIEWIEWIELIELIKWIELIELIELIIELID